MNGNFLINSKFNTVTYNELSLYNCKLVFIMIKHYSHFTRHHVQEQPRPIYMDCLQLIIMSLVCPSSISRPLLVGALCLIHSPCRCSVQADTARREIRLYMLYI